MLWWKQVHYWVKLSTEDEIEFLGPRVSVSFTESVRSEFPASWAASCWQRLMSGHVGQRPVRKSLCRWFSGWWYTSCQFSLHPLFGLRVPLFEDCLLYHCTWQCLSTCWQIMLCTSASNREVDMRYDMSTNTKGLSNCDTHKASSD